MIALFPIHSYSATQGTLGATSTGTILISATIVDLVIISGLNDIAFGTYSGTGAMSANDSFCVYKNGTGRYSARLTGTGGTTTPGFFIKHATLANEMAYTATYTDNVPTVNAATSGVTIGTALVPLLGHATSQNCAGGTNATITLGISAVVAQAAVSGVYSGTLTVLISPL